MEACKRRDNPRRIHIGDRVGDLPEGQGNLEETPELAAPPDGRSLLRGLTAAVAGFHYARHVHVRRLAVVVLVAVAPEPAAAPVLPLPAQPAATTGRRLLAEF